MAEPESHPPTTTSTPEAGSHAAPAAADAAGAPHLRAPVLVVDDEPDIRAFIRLALEDEGYAVLTAEHGRQALDVLRTHRARLILLDLRMPHMDGEAFVAAYQETPPPHAPVVMLTASRAYPNGDAGPGIAGTLRKPVMLDALLEAIERFSRE